MSGSIYAIPASQIVSVIPSVLSVGGTGIDLQGIFLTTNPRVPIGQVLAFPSAQSVQQFFGAASQEAAVAGTYFLAFDGSSIKPASVMFVQYNQAAVGAWLLGASVSDMTIEDIQAIPVGTLTVEIDGVPTTSAAIDLSTATSPSNAAEIISEALALQGPQTASFQGDIALTVLTVTAIAAGGMINVGDEVQGATVAAGTQIVAQTAGTPGQNGTYTVNISQTVAAEAMTTNEPVVTYDSVTGGFYIVSSTTGPTSNITYASGAIAAELQLTEQAGATLSQGAVAATPAATMDAVAAFTQNWATFTTLFDPDGGVGNTVKQAFAQWNNDTVDNHVYVAWDTDPTPTQSIEAPTSLGWILQQANTSGTVPIYSPYQGPTVAAFLMGAIAAVNFSQANGRKTLAFRTQSGIAPDVVSGFVAANLQANGYNYYGNWAAASQQFSFFYPGSISGPFSWIDSYINQIWMNNQFQLALFNLLFNAGSIPYNPAGYTQIIGVLTGVINQALSFGAVRTGISLSAGQIIEVNAAAGVTINQIISSQGYYIQVLDATPQIRAARGSPPCSVWYADGGAVQKLILNSVMIQ